MKTTTFYCIYSFSRSFSINLFIIKALFYLILIHQFIIKVTFFHINYYIDFLNYKKCKFLIFLSYVLPRAKLGHDASIVMMSLPPHKNARLHFMLISYRQYFSLFFLSRDSFYSLGTGIDQKERKNQENAPTVRISSRTSLPDARREIPIEIAILQFQYYLL